MYAQPGTAFRATIISRPQNLVAPCRLDLLSLLSHGDDGTPATKIAPQMGLEPRSLTRLLKSMEDQKLIVRKADKAISALCGFS